MVDLKPQNPDTQIIIFAREPVYGQVKTRLIPVLGKTGATELYSALLDFSVHKIHRYKLASLCLCITPESQSQYFSRHYPFDDLLITKQTGKDLGQRMANALEQSLQQFSKAILIGTDCPFLDNTDLQQAIDALDSNDMVFSPAKDGGYVLVGGTGQLNSFAFEGIEWGTERVMQQTRQRLSKLNIHWQELRQQQDIDNKNDLKYLQHGHEFFDSGLHISDLIQRNS